mgnify:CR=1 FL=1
MKISYRSALLLLVAAALVVATQQAAAQKEYRKLAQTGMKFLSVGAAAREAAMADAFTSVDGSVTAMFFNTAGMAYMNSFADAYIGRTEWLADIKHIHGAIALSPWNGDYGVLGVTIQFVDYGEVQSTILARNAKGYLDVGTFKPSAYAIGIGYAKALTERFSVGGNVKFVNQNLGPSILDASYVKDGAGLDSAYTADREVKDNMIDVPAFDLGVLYKTGFKSLAFGMTIRNFAREVAYISEKFQLPLTFRIGLSMNVMDLFNIDRESQQLLLTVDAEHPRDFPEQLKVGVEYGFANTLALRVG